MVNKKNFKILKINDAARKMFALPLDANESFDIVGHVKNKFRVNIGNDGYLYFEGETIDNCNRIFEVYTKFIHNQIGDQTEKIVVVIRDVTAIKAEERKKLNLLEVTSYQLKARITEARVSLKQRQDLKAAGEECEKMDELAEKLLLLLKS